MQALFSNNSVKIQPSPSSSSNSKANEEIPVLDNSKIMECFQLVLTSTDEKTRKLADNFLINCERNPMFYSFLLEIFENSKENVMKLQAIVSFKNLIIRNWNNRRSHLKNQVFFGEQVRKEIKTTLLNFLEKLHEKNFRTQVNLALSVIIKSDFPANFPELFNFFTRELKSIQMFIENGKTETIYSENTMNFFKSLKMTLKEQSKKRLANAMKLFNDFTSHILTGVKYVWDFVSSELSKLGEKDSKQSIIILNLSKVLDKIILFSMMCGYNELHKDLFVVQMVRLLLVKSANFIGLLNQNPQIQPIIQNLKIITINLSTIQSIFPLLFHEHLLDFAQMAFILIEKLGFSDENLLKSAEISLLKILKTFLYYSDSDSFSLSLHSSKIANSQEIQMMCSNKFYTFFNENCIQTLLNSIIVKLLPFASNKLKLNDENLIETEDENFLDDTVNELENSLYNITLCLADNLFVRFSNICLMKINEILMNGLSNNFNQIDYDIQNSLFGVVALLPKAFDREKVNLLQFVNIYQIIDYLRINIDISPYFARRIPILINKWIKYFPDDQKINLCQLIVVLLNKSTDLIVKYDCAICLKTLIKQENLKLSFIDLISEVGPIIIELFTNFFSSSILWPLIQLLTLLIEKCQFNCPENMIKILENPSLLVLMQNDSELLRGALIDMFKNLIVSFSLDTKISSIFLIIFKFIDIVFSQKAEIDNGIIRLWYFTIKEYSSLQGIDNDVKTIFLKYYDKMNQNLDESNISIFLYLIEEYILLGFIQKEDFTMILDLIQNKYFFADQEMSENIEEAIEIKTACLNLLITIILTLMGKNQNNFSIFEKIIIYIIKDIHNPNFDKMLKGIIAFKTGLMSFFNRFLINDPSGMFLFLKNLGVDLKSFIQNWLSNMDYLSSKNACKINTFAILQIFPLLDKEIFIINLEMMLKQIIPDIHTFIENSEKIIDNEKIGTLNKGRFLISQSRLNENKLSVRKEENRKYFLYEEINMKILFIERLNEILNRFGINLTDLTSLIKDKVCLERLGNIINA